MSAHASFTVRTRSRNELVDITDGVRSALRDLGAGSGVALVATPHTTAAITINENADPAVCRDLVETLSRLVPADQRHFTHAEGNSDSHLKSSLVGASEAILVEGGHPVLGTWQGIYFCEFDGPRTRTVRVGMA
jgi:secondary thiamine-phosphate synthase enzyme